jgi:[ribosomal protein S5]-alanine N-acetyltransferase
MPALPDRLDTDRLVLRRPRPEDALAYRRLWEERDPRVPAHRRVAPDGTPSVADIAARLDDPAQADVRTVEHRETEEVLGYCGLRWDGAASDTEPELVYELARAHHGRGYATEAARAVLAWADAAGVRRIRASVRAWNAASLRVLEKLGFRGAGVHERDPIHGDSILTVREP